MGMMVPATILTGVVLSLAPLWLISRTRSCPTCESRRRGMITGGVIVLVAGLLRFGGLDSIPNGLFRDEVEKGYTAWTLAREGGALEFTYDPARPFAFHKHPLHVRVGGVTTSAIYQYASIPFVAVMGLSPGSTRMAAALAGTLTVALLMLLLAKVWNPVAGLAAGLLLAVQPWHLVFSRWAAQGIFVPLLMTAVLAGLAGAERRRRWGFPLAGLGLGAVYYAYSGAQPFALAWGAVLTVQYRRELRAQWREALCGAALFLVCAGPTAWVTVFAGGDARLSAVAVWNAPDATPLLTAWRIVSSWARHFNPVFLFLQGDALARHGLPGQGQLMAVDLLLMPAGAWLCVRTRSPLWRALLSAFLVGPVGAAITWGHIPHSLRAMPMLLPAAAWSGLALVALADRQGALKPPRWAGVVVPSIVAALAFITVGRYCLLYQGDPECTEAFESSYRRAFEEAASGRSVTERVFVDARLPYAPYQAAFHGGIPAREIAAEGIERSGWMFYDFKQAEEIAKRSAPGDWIIALDPRAQARVFRKTSEGLIVPARRPRPMD